MANVDALGMIECSRMSLGSVIADAMLKTASVELLMAQPVPPGKLLVVVHGGVADVEAAVAVGLDRAGDALVDAFFIPRLHPKVAAAIMAPVEGLEVEALGMVETKTVASAIRAADASLKAAKVDLVSIRLGLGIAGRAIYYVTGSVADAQAAVEAGRAAIRVPDLLIDSAVIAQPHSSYAQYMASGPGIVRPLPGVQAPAEG